MRIYSDLAPWFHLLTAPSEYADEAAEHIRLIRLLGTDPKTLLELGSGGGNNASYLKHEFTCTPERPLARDAGTEPWHQPGM